MAEKLEVKKRSSTGLSAGCSMGFQVLNMLLTARKDLRDTAKTFWE
jgi:hypothetical protein